jgi:hypothetical protein
MSTQEASRQERNLERNVVHASKYMGLRQKEGAIRAFMTLLEDTKVPMDRAIRFKPAPVESRSQGVLMARVPDLGIFTVVGARKDTVLEPLVGQGNTSDEVFSDLLDKCFGAVSAPPSPRAARKTYLNVGSEVAQFTSYGRIRLKP